jgi:hypothetical protein
VGGCNEGEKDEAQYSESSAKSVLRVKTAYRTTSEDAILVIIGTPPIDLLAAKRKAITVEIKKLRGTQRWLRDRNDGTLPHRPGSHISS